MTFYLRPIALAESPQSEEGEAVRLAGGLVYASRFALIERRDGKVLSRRRLSVMEINGLPDEAQEQWQALRQTRAPLHLELKGGGARTIRLDRPQVLGVLNVTPDSFSDAGTFFGDPGAAQAHAAAMIEAGAAMIDVGGESTRPGAVAVGEGDELQRVVPAVERLAALGAAISVDTRRPAVMAAALAAGAQVFNDVSALRHDPRSLEFAARAGVPVVLMHAPGEGEDLHAGGACHDIVLDVFDWLRARRDAAVAAGIAREKIVLDPGIGFGKSLADNLALLNALPLFHALGQPLLAGVSRKRMIGALSHEAPVHRRLGGSLALAVKAMDAGVQLLRVHDVAETVQAVRVWCGLRNAALADFGQMPAV
ncbi:MAG: dihydropteroate synthase [Novosphingobium sp.]|jgi:dihydropteroate synthase|nr:dihydropteroate synthase [Novosphingobium sp.]